MSTQLTVNEDQTVTSTWVGKKGRGSLFQVMSGGNIKYVNVLDLMELWAVIASVQVAPFPLGQGEKIYRKILEQLKTDPSKLFANGIPDVKLGELRKYLVIKAGDGCNAPHDSYLRMAYKLKIGEHIDFPY